MRTLVIVSTTAIIVLPLLIVNYAYAHAVCGAGYCGKPCAPLRLITECGQTPNGHEQAAFTALFSGTVGFGIFAILRNRARRLTC